MAAEKAEILLIGAAKPAIVGGLEPSFVVHRLIEAKDPEAFLKDVAPRIRGIAIAYTSNKIDGAFIRDLQSDSTNRLFVAAMIDIAHSLNKVVIAEHVEDAETLELLRGMGVDFVQGFYFGLPGPNVLDAAKPRPVENV